MANFFFCLLFLDWNPLANCSRITTLNSHIVGTRTSSLTDLNSHLFYSSLLYFLADLTIPAAFLFPNFISRGLEPHARREFHCEVLRFSFETRSPESSWDVETVTYWSIVHGVQSFYKKKNKNETKKDTTHVQFSFMSVKSLNVTENASVMWINDTTDKNVPPTNAFIPFWTRRILNKCEQKKNNSRAMHFTRWGLKPGVT